MDAKKKQMDSEDYREPRGDRYGGERSEASEFDVPEEVETWGLDDLSDLVPTTFD